MRLKMFWNEEIETMSRQDLEELQLKKLQATVKRAFDKIPYYNRRYTEAGVFPEDIETLKDIEKLPFITKDDLRESYPFGLFAVDISEIKELHSSSGTTGKPVVSGYTEKDLDTWAEVTARGLTRMGLGKDDIIQNTHGYGLFTGGFGVHYGSHKIGAAIIPISTGQTRRQIEIMSDFGTTGIIFTPSYGIHLGEVALEDGIDPKDLGIKAIGFGAEGWTEEMRKRIEEIFGAPAYNIYGLTELMGPGVAIECEAQNGLHIAEDIFYPEIIDPNTGKTLGENTPGELVLTNLEREGMPVIRFRTKDLTKITYEKCSCGITHARMSRITGRSDDMIKVKGVAIFPSQIEKALLKVGDAEPHYMIIVTRPGTLDEIEVKVEASQEIFFDGVKEMMAVQNKIGKSIENETGIRVKVTLVEPKTLPRFEGKAKRVIDERDLH
jgi:phenylacetate-CoA ligase